jgi:hypothetical protein
LGVIVANTVAVLTTAVEKRAEWRATIENALKDAQPRGPDWLIEVDFFTAILARLDGQPATLPPDHPYGPALAQIEAGLAGGALDPEVPELDVSDDLARAVQAFLDSESWDAARTVVEAHQALLLQPQAAALLAALGQQARAGENIRAAELFELHAAVLTACQADGIDQTFDRLRQADETQGQPAALPGDFAARMAAALRGPGPLKAQTYDELTALGQAQPALLPLVKAVQSALFGAPLAEAGQALTGEQAAVWSEIVALVKTQPPGTEAP